MNIKILFEKQANITGVASGWGISYLIDDRVLFDLGEKEEFFENNLKKLKIDIEKIEKVVISHSHWDHWGGLSYLLRVNKKLEFFVAPDFYKEFNAKLKGQQVKIVQRHEQICENVYTLGSFKVAYKDKEIYEQVLCLRTDKGLTIICGCAHPGLLEYIQKAKEVFRETDVYLIMGGFHLIDKEKRVIDYIAGQMKKQGVLNVGPGHCTGFEAVKILKNYYSDNLIDLSVGSNIGV